MKGQAERILMKSIIHPAINARPPMGVMAPIHLIPVRTNIYKLPENIKIPADNNRAGN